MKELKQFPTTDYNKFPQKYYFESIAKNIIKIGNLKNNQIKPNKTTRITIASTAITINKQQEQ